MEYIYCVENIDFKSRIKKQLPMIFIFSFFFVIVYLLIENKNFWLYDFALISPFPLFLIIITILENKYNIYKIIISEETIHIFGTRYNENWNETFQIEKVKIKIIESRAKSGHILGYIIEVKIAEKCYRINKMFNWNNFVLYELFKTFKKIKCEKITSDEIRLLDKIEQKAQDKFEWEY